LEVALNCEYRLRDDANFVCSGCGKGGDSRTVSEWSYCPYCGHKIMSITVLQKGGTGGVG
jgi:DNA-directed RNA polymerase subunit RPC12/RpoP